MNFKKFIGTRSFYKSTLTVAVPLMLQQLIISSVNLIDNLMIGQLGDVALGGVASVNRFYMIANFGTMGVLAASAIFIAQYYGAKNEEKMRESFRFSILCALLIMTMFFFLALQFPRSIIGFFTQNEEIILAGLDYCRIAAWTFIPLAISLCITSALRAIGLTKIPLLISSIAVAVNAFLNYGLIFGHFGMPRMEIAGAALATLIARLVEVGLLLFVIARNDFPFKTKLRQLTHVPVNLTKRILIKALPLATNEVLWSFGMATLFKFYATRGAEVMSGYSAASTISDLFFVLFGGMAAATTVMIAQPLGANELDKARKQGYQLLGFSVMLSLVFGTLMFLSSFIVPHLYNISPVAKEVTVNALRIMAVMFWIYMANTQCYFTLRAGGDTRSTLFMDSGFMWLINIPLVGLFTYYTDLNIISLYIVGQSTDLVKFFVAYRLVRKEKWVVNLTVHQEDPLILAEEPTA